MNPSGQPPKPPTTNREIRVFIYSTFRDIQVERDHLMRFVP